MLALVCLVNSKFVGIYHITHYEWSITIIYMA